MSWQDLQDVLKARAEHSLEKGMLFYSLGQSSSTPVPVSYRVLYNKAATNSTIIGNLAKFKPLYVNVGGGIGRILFENIKTAMAADSVLLVDERVLPPTGIGHIAASIDLTMMGAFASMERTEAEWRELAASVGLELVWTYPYNALDHECVMDMRLLRTA
ncbi:hypothetical protein GGR52DRAFT_567397 [Hypoxylon sp. FL1284]|nr:hypothetical protein GGR52DRAFT_567397 [Hypoxylon sp. FL1284]